MKGLFITALAAATLSLAAASLAQAQAPDEDEALESLRGAQPVDATSGNPEPRKMVRQNKPIPREFEQQPPLIPHSIDNFQINLDQNKCLNCHVGSDEKDPVGTPISGTHFTSAEDGSSTSLSAARYFCTQCHVPQADVSPIVRNEVKSSSGTP